jgi:hypothetical protein
LASPIWQKQSRPEIFQEYYILPLEERWPGDVVDPEPDDPRHDSSRVGTSCPESLLLNKPPQEPALSVRAGLLEVVFRFPERRTSMSGENERYAYEPEAGPGWISRAEARALLGVSEMELREIFHGLRLSRRTVSLYSKSEIRALATVAKQLR